ncbi:hypothetical protein GS894_06885 [Rhodococcus hoagii]|uniref:Uncharacterized protein n=1 Tax=Rhodococcus hoagii (strain 103S) TaxID=685727 RepID=A0A3S5Y5C4_RHOH1|nr:hypothetical protein [Prescottella equi]MDP8016215.1 hypothetical protein [Prescottella equi]NKR85907.1 hypothetical protein [Prescottella equi]NKS05947.1 hypothetical protein [Prescottella equi]NKS94784.1 hypothetical protein [Prescottella equi]NKT08143.1 hypothetical protein [Prescottella equi]
MSDAVQLRKSNQEQAVAAWVNYLNQLRLDNLLSAFRRQDMNLNDALASVDEAIRKIDLEVVAANRGGVKGMHGFIAEVAEVGIGNARSQIHGGDAVYQWVNDNGPVDLMRNGVDIQQKFVAAGGRFGLGAIAEHLQKYPDFLENGSKYQVPRDHYETIQKLHAMSREEAGKLLSHGGDGYSLKQWERVHAFFADNPVGIESLEPSHLEYGEVQKGAYAATMEAEKKSLRSTAKSLKDDAHHESKPTLREGAKATLAAAAIEGGTAVVLAVVEKRREGKQLKDFTGEDWADIAGKGGFGVAKGGVRGFSIYGLTNFTATPAAVASSIVTAAFGVAEQANKLRRGEIDELEFIENAELVCLETAISALSSFVGQALIPVPVLGAVIGNTVGVIMYKAVSSSLSKREASLIERYLGEQRALDEQLAAEYQELIEKLDASMSDYLGVLERAFSPDVEVALLGSVELALELGVASEEVLNSDEKVLAYFLD